MAGRHPSPFRAAALTATALLVALCAAGALAALLQIRAQITSASRDLVGQSRAIGDLPYGPVTRERIQQVMDAVAGPALLRGRFGQEVARTGAPDLWQRGEPGWAARLASAGTGARVRDGSVVATRALSGSRQVELRRDLGREATTIGSGTALTTGVAALVASLCAGLLVYLARRRRAARLDRVAAIAEAIAGGRPVADDQLVMTGELGRVAASIRSSGERLASLAEMADRELGVLAAAIEPLPVGVAGRGPAGARLRNVAMERLGEGLVPEDRVLLDGAVAEALDAAGPVSRRVGLRDGRVLEIDAWTIPGGRLVAAAERTEQDRLARLRRQLESSATRQLRAPLDEIKARGSELYKHVPAPAAPTLRKMFGAVDRLDRVVRMMLRGTAHDEMLRPPRSETFGVAGFLWGLAHDWDAALRQKALRVELDVADDLPAVRTDPALVEEILTELIDNAAKYTPRGGTVAISARGGDGAVVIEVSDTGGGVAAQDVAHVQQRFFRGQDAESIPGAGLGLGVAAALAERLGGALIVAPGPGGRVRLELPASDAVPALTAA